MKLVTSVNYIVERVITSLPLKLYPDWKLFFFT